MNSGPLCAPSPQHSQPKKILVKKVISSLLAGLAVSFAAHHTVRDLPYSIAAGDDVSAVPQGLSRQRPAFRKALSMLAEAAPTNPRLADYYERVTRRVNGQSAQGEDNVGAGAVVTLRRNNADRLDTTMIRAASVVPAEVAFQALITVAQAAGQAEPASPPNPSIGADSDSQAEGGPSPQGRLTVGDIAFDTNPAIEQWIDYYGANPLGRRTLKVGIERSGSYLDMARAEFRSAGVPEDLVWLAFVESVWTPSAVSRAAAGGLWQFISATATEYGLKVQSGNDERADPFKQTHVAAVYLRDLYTIFGDWALAMAAYNAGEPRVMGAIVKNGNADFWELCDKQLLPRETCNYVPKILASIRLASRAGDYGLIREAEAPVSAGG